MQLGAVREKGLKRLGGSCTKYEVLDIRRQGAKRRSIQSKKVEREQKPGREREQWTSTLRLEPCKSRARWYSAKLRDAQR